MCSETISLSQAYERININQRKSGFASISSPQGSIGTIFFPHKCSILTIALTSRRNVTPVSPSCATLHCLFPVSGVCWSRSFSTLVLQGQELKLKLIKACHISIRAAPQLVLLSHRKFNSVITTLLLPTLSLRASVAATYTRAAPNWLDQRAD